MRDQTLDPEDPMSDIGVLPPSSINNNAVLIIRGCRICEAGYTLFANHYEIQ